MRRVLYVAEKNDVAKGVAAILSRGQMQRREGHSKYNKIYQLQDTFQNTPALIAVTSVSGHLMASDFGPEMKGWQNVPIEDCFTAPIKYFVPETFKGIARTLKEEAAKSDTLVIWTDCDREGENIGMEIVKVCKEANRHIDVYRANEWTPFGFSEITAAAVHRAVANLIRLDNKVVDAVDCRQELDLRIGAAFTRLQTLTMRARTGLLLGDDKQVVSYGPCQFPTLGFVVDRFREVQNFVEESFWKLVVEVSREGQKVEMQWERVRLFDRNAVDLIYDECRDVGTATIDSVTRKEKSRWRPTALDTVELEKLAVRKLKMSAKQAMTIAEKLYSKGWISYPRTETNKFPPELALAPLVQAQSHDNSWGAFAEEVAQRGPNARNGKKSDEAHPPIHPLKHATRDDLPGDEWRLYELVVRHFLACVSWDAKGMETRVAMSIGEERFAATGLQIEDMGYMQVYPYDKWTDKTLPRFNEGEAINEFVLRIVDGKTSPPLLLNEADLITLMDHYGIGTDATHAEHIEKIKERKYAGVTAEGRFLPGFLGLALVDAYDDMEYEMSKPHLRADLERQLVEICNGTKTKQQVLEDQIAKYTAIFQQTQLNKHLFPAKLTSYLNNNSNGGGGPPPPGGGRGGQRVHNTANRGRAQVAQVPQHALPAAGANTRGRGRGRGGGGMGGGGAAAAGRGRGAGGTTAGARGRGGRGGGQRPPPVHNEEKPCTCGEPTVMRTVQKEGPNKGKMFWTCAKPMGAADKCNFFEWAQ